MRRTAVALLIAVAVPSTARASPLALPFQAGADKKPASPAPAEPRQKIIEAIDADFAKTLDRLNQSDPGAQTRLSQKRILEGIDKLLHQQDPGKPPPAPNQPPAGGDSPQPSPGNPPTASKEKTPQPQPEAKSVPGEPTRQADIAGQLGAKPNTPAAVQEEKPGAEAWPDIPRRHRAGIEAHGRERFIRNYEELLRAYYRNIAENARPQDGE